MSKKDTTTIALHRSTVEKIKSLQDYSTESYEGVINRSLSTLLKTRTVILPQISEEQIQKRKECPP